VAVGKDKSASVSACVKSRNSCGSPSAESLANSRKTFSDRLKETDGVGLQPSACSQSPTRPDECILPSDSADGNAEGAGRQEICLLPDENCQSGTGADDADDVARGDAIKNYGMKLQAALSELSDNLEHRELIRIEYGLDGNQSNTTAKLGVSNCKLAVFGRQK
jgi:hypothetical protein